LSALQKYALCPYQFLLGAIYRLQPAEDLEPLQHLDPLTRGSLFHAVQTSFYRQMKADAALPITNASRERALEALEVAVQRVAATYHELLAPAVERVWNDEIGGIRRDLRLWVDQISRDNEGWMPRWFEWGFGLGAVSRSSGDDVERDRESVPDPVTIDGRFKLRGSIDLVEARIGTEELRVTDHKTGRYRGRQGMVVGGGAMLQPVLYSLALEAATGRTVTEGRLYYATTDGGYQETRIPLTAETRRIGIEVLEIIDRGIERGLLAPVPSERDRACSWCDFRPVCGPMPERRVGHKAPELISDLLELRKKP
jgi:CRISPR/Cas system-associated exonuclease Cas4 (RecB family)